MLHSTHGPCFPFSTSFSLFWVLMMSSTREQLCNVDFFGCTNPAPIPFAPVDFQLALLNPLHARKQLWQSSWLNGQALMDLFPDLHKLAWRKNKTVKEFQNQNWTRWLWRMQSVSEMADFVSLWDAVQEIQLTDQPDQITWKWTANGEYTPKSAYSAQFFGVLQ